MTARISGPAAPGLAGPHSSAGPGAGVCHSPASFLFCFPFGGSGAIREASIGLSRVSSVVEQRFCKPLVGSSNLSPGTSKIKCL
jgi:hypothetical protein